MSSSYPPEGMGIYASRIDRHSRASGNPDTSRQYWIPAGACPRLDRGREWQLGVAVRLGGSFSICRVGCAHRTRLRSPSNGGRSPPYEHYWFMGSIRDRRSVVGSTHEPAAGGRTDFPSPTGRRRSEGPGEGDGFWLPSPTGESEARGAKPVGDAGEGPWPRC